MPSLAEVDSVGADSCVGNSDSSLSPAFLGCCVEVKSRSIFTATGEAFAAVLSLADRGRQPDAHLVLKRGRSAFKCEGVYFALTGRCKRCKWLVFLGAIGLCG